MMSEEKLAEVLDRYEAILVQPAGDGDWRTEHLRTMVPKMREFLAEDRREKLMRWIGFMQGALWSLEWYSLEELKDHNRPDA